MVFFVFKWFCAWINRLIQGVEILLSIQHLIIIK